MFYFFKTSKNGFLISLTLKHASISLNIVKRMVQYINKIMSTFSIFQTPHIQIFFVCLSLSLIFFFFFFLWCRGGGWHLILLADFVEKVSKNEQGCVLLKISWCSVVPETSHPYIPPLILITTKSPSSNKTIF